MGWGISGGRETEIVSDLTLDLVIRGSEVVRAAGLAGPCARPERLVDDGLDGARAPSALCAATEAAIDLLRMAQDIVSAADGVAHIVISKDVAGTDDHENVG